MKRLLFTVSLISIFLSGYFATPDIPNSFIPITGFQPDVEVLALENQSTLPKFVARVSNNGDPSKIAGLFLTGLLELPVLQQPPNNPGYVSSDPDAVTQFAMVNQYGSIALLAHNNLAGQKFFGLKEEQILSLVYGDGQVTYYQIIDILEYQALSPNSPYSNFIDLDDPEGKTISVSDLFYEIYAQPDQLILQTCIEAEGQQSWGRLFIIAVPVSPFPPAEIM